jgi:hypothetical protein
MARRHWIMGLVAAAGCLTLVVVVVGGAALFLTAQLRLDVGPGDPAPAVTLTELGGESLPLESLRGKVVVLDFWSSW